MHKSFFVLALALALAFLLLPPTISAEDPPLGEYNYRLIDVDFPNLSFQSGQAFGVNNRGDVAGSYSINVEPGVSRARGFLFTKGEIYSAHYPDAMATNLHGVSDRGELAGNYRDAVTELWHGFTYFHGSYTVVDFPGATQTWVRQINARGDVAGEWRDPANKLRGFVRRGGIFVTIDVPGSTSTVARGINPQGDVVGYFQDPLRDPAYPNRYFPFLFTRDGAYVADMPEPEPTRTYVANGISADGDIVGYYIQRSQPDPVYIGFVMRKDGSFTKVFIPGYYCSTVTGVAANGKLAATAWNFVRGGNPAWTYWAYLLDPQGPKEK